MFQRSHLLYLSRLSPDVSPGCVADIVRAARARNEARQINSLLIFDGWRFCQYFEGDAPVLNALAERIRADRRHVGFRLLHQDALSGPALLAAYGLDYALSYDDSLAAFETAAGHEAIRLLQSVFPHLDREPSAL